MKYIKYFLFTLFIVIIFFFTIEMILRVTNTGNPENIYNEIPGFNKKPFFITDKSNPEIVTVDPSYLVVLHDIKIKKQPDPGEFRVFMYGGSNTHYLDEKEFEKTFNNDKNLTSYGNFKFYNLGGAGFGSRRIRELFDQTIVYKPSVIFIYMGNNEFLDFLLKSSDLENKRQFSLIRSRLSNAYTYNFLKNIYTKNLKPTLSLDKNEIKERIFDNPCQLYDNKYAGYIELRTFIYSMYLENLIYIVNKAKQNNIPVILATVPSNEMVPVFYPYYPENITAKQKKDIKKLEKQADTQISDFLPFLKVSSSQYSFARILYKNKEGTFKDLDSYKQIFFEPIRLAKAPLDKLKPVKVTNKLKKQLDQSANLYNQALKISGDVPQIHYKLGVVYYLLKDFKKARYHFRESMRLDATPLRSSPTINQIIHEVAANEKADLIEFEDNLCLRGYQGICDWSLFRDYVHLNSQSKNVLITMFKDKLEKLNLKKDFKKGN